MDRRTKNVNIFKDSVDLINESSRLQQAIKESETIFGDNIGITILNLGLAIG